MNTSESTGSEFRGSDASAVESVEESTSQVAARPAAGAAQNSRIRPMSLLLACAALAVAIFAVRFEPVGSRGDMLDSGLFGDSPRTLHNAAGDPLVGELVSRDVIVRIYSTGEGLRYTVCRPDGAVLADGLTSSEVGDQFPDLDLDRLFFEPGSGIERPGALMSAEPISGRTPHE